MSATPAKLPRPLYRKSIELLGHPGTAVDLAFGAGNEVLDLLQRGRVQLESVELDGKALSGPKHWHRFDLVARRV